MALDHLPVAGPAPGAERGPDGDRAGALRRLRRQVAVRRLRLVFREVGGGEREDLGEQPGIADEGEPAVVRDVEPLVPVGDDGVRPVDPLRQRCDPRRDAREEPEGAVDVQPGAVLLGEVGELGQRVELAHVHVARVADDDRGRRRELAQRSLERREVDASRRVARERLHRRAADADHGQRLERARVDEAARQHRHGGQPGHAVAPDVAVVLLPHHCRAAARPMKLAPSPRSRAPLPTRRGARRAPSASRARRSRGACRAASRPS